MGNTRLVTVHDVSSLLEIMKFQINLFTLGLALISLVRGKMEREKLIEGNKRKEQGMASFVSLYFVKKNIGAKEKKDRNYEKNPL